MQVHVPETEAAPRTAGVKTETPSGQASPLRRRVLWIAGIAVVLALLVLTPPLVNANRYRGKIAESMSKSLGRPVHLDNVSLHLLPVPGFTLQNLVVSEDPAFGAEPTIRANTVEATLRVSSLWHHPVEFSTVRFVEPSVNLVRNAQGRWNLSDVLLNASHVESAPTNQRRAGPKPRFPYIEATGGRVNVKLGAEKLPYSLTDADFALWLPSPQQWRVRLVGHPARTDTTITDPGQFRIEGELHRAATVAQVPVDFRATWHDAPLGEATRILAGDDWGWRGTVNVDASLTGTLGDAQLASKWTLGDLRRGEFFPAHPLDIQVTCTSGFMLHPATLSALRCTLPDSAPTPLTLEAAKVPLQDPKQAEATVQGAAIPARWALMWAAMFSPRVPTTLVTTGTVDVSLQRNNGRQLNVTAAKTSGRRDGADASRAAAAVPRAGWTGDVRLTVPAMGEVPAGEQDGGTSLDWAVQPAAVARNWPSLHLPATAVDLGQRSSVVVSGDAGESGYSFTVSGTASPAALLEPTRYFPPLGDGIEAAIDTSAGAAEPAKVQFTCARGWGQAQQCHGN